MQQAIYDYLVSIPKLSQKPPKGLPYLAKESGVYVEEMASGRGMGDFWETFDGVVKRQFVAIQ